ncbi:hypothetical protein STCU_01210 [Strigomonas culicis]|uniref:Uncharacterized protein n=1 Tax=Strigomonas culicis TaxID=28005 RepID=S9WH95_9TRYP|nr:hypothetical protein STCU_01210 [Strigomonas culicis]|eukprot:EPY35180.1 hypothetical protein STCU_01210 [Strigomonas culicis]
MRDPPRRTAAAAGRVADAQAERGRSDLAAGDGEDPARAALEGRQRHHAGGAQRHRQGHDGQQAAAGPAALRRVEQRQRVPLLHPPLPRDTQQPTARGDGGQPHARAARRRREARHVRRGRAGQVRDAVGPSPRERDPEHTAEGAGGEPARADRRAGHAGRGDPLRRRRREEAERGGLQRHLGGSRADLAVHRDEPPLRAGDPRRGGAGPAARRAARYGEGAGAHQADDGHGGRCGGGSHAPGCVGAAQQKVSKQKKINIQSV